MSEPTGPRASAALAFVGDDLTQLGAVLRAAFTHPWVASYQIGFGPPLVRANPALVAALDAPRALAALDKLDAYLTHCVYPEAERTRLTRRHTAQLVRRHGPLEAEAVRAASTDVLDLSLRLRDPLRAPPDVRRDMEALGVTEGAVPADLAPDEQAARFWVTLGDPRNTRLLHVPAVAARARDPDVALALELRLPAALWALYCAWARALSRDAGLTVLELGAPTSVARVSRDGRRY